MKGQIVVGVEIDSGWIELDHRGDLGLFWDAMNLQCLCTRHDGEKTGLGEQGQQGIVQRLCGPYDADCCR